MKLCLAQKIKIGFPLLFCCFFIINIFKKLSNILFFQQTFYKAT